MEHRVCYGIGIGNKNEIGIGNKNENENGK